MLEAKNINKYYLNGKDRIHVLKDASLNISPGEIAAIVGPSGAGKSTLLHILGGLDNPTSGEILFEGKRLKGLTDSDLSAFRNKSIGFVFQFYHLLPEFTILENVMMPAVIAHKRTRLPVCRSKEKALEILEIVGLKNRLNHLPNQLSGGEQQRVAIARALINEPVLLLCDEPTGNLDSENGKQICRLLENLNRQKGMAIVMVTHNIDVASLASKVYNIVDGQLKHQETITNFQ